MGMLFRLFAVLALAAAFVVAERHVVSFNNGCGYGTPKLISQTGEVLSTGAPYISNGPLVGAIAYLQTGSCGLNGDKCTLVETTLTNPPSNCNGCGSSTDISLIPPHTFSVASGFIYSNGCDGTGTKCSSSSCNTAFRVSTDNHVQVACQAADVDLIITFCI